MTILIFHGPSISICDADRLTPAMHAPPIKRGDLDAVGGYSVIVILDGEFGQSLAISAKEILRAIARGIVVIGASSMGALRASELDRDGMIGVGWIYNHFRRCTIRRDDDVAIAYSPVDFVPLTVATIDVKYWTSRLVAAGLITRRDKERFIRVARSIFFSERTKERLIAAFQRAFGAARVDSLLASTAGELPSIKALDAQAAIRVATMMASRRTMALNEQVRPS
jgi:hypothetical protein